MFVDHVNPHIIFSSLVLFASSRLAVQVSSSIAQHLHVQPVVLTATSMEKNVNYDITRIKQFR